MVKYHRKFKPTDAVKYFAYKSMVGVFLPFFDAIYYIYLNTFGLIGTFIKTTQWK